jgi:hypothetical protein
VTKARAHMLKMRLAGVGLALALFAACGDDGNVTAPPTPAPPTPVPPTPVPSTLLIRGEKALEAPPKGKTRTGNWDFTTPEVGSVEVTISYVHDDSQILVWVTDRQCNKWQFEKDHCFYLTKSLAGPRPRTLTARGVEKGTYSLFVANDGPHEEQVGYEVRLKPRPSSSGR